MSVSLEWVVLFAQTTTMVLAALLLAYPLIRHSRNVAHTEGMVGLAIGFFALAGGWSVLLFTDYILLYRSLVLVAALFGLVGAAYFALPFIHIGDQYDESEFVSGGGAPTDDATARDATAGAASNETTDHETTDADDGGFGDAVRE